jgi:hypothetical protein
LETPQAAASSRTPAGQIFELLDADIPVDGPAGG